MKFKIGDVIIINAPNTNYESRFNGQKAVIIDFYLEFACLNQDYVAGQWYVPMKWLLPSNETKIKERLGIK